MTARYCWSEDGERFQGDYESRAFALEEGREELDDGVGVPTVWTAIRKPIDFGSLVAMHRLGDDAEEAVFEIVGDAAEAWRFNPSKEAEADLRATLTEWAKRHGQQPTCWGVEGIEEHAPPSLP